MCKEAGHSCHSGAFTPFLKSLHMFQYSIKNTLAKQPGYISPWENITYQSLWENSTYQRQWENSS